MHDHASSQYFSHLYFSSLISSTKLSITEFKHLVFETFPYQIRLFLLLPREYFVFAIIFVFVFADCLISTGWWMLALGADGGLGAEHGSNN